MSTDTERKRFKIIPEMEGAMARRYDKIRGTSQQLEAYHREAAGFVSGLAADTRVLEVAPGPGYLAIEMAEYCQVTGLDVSRTFVEIAAEKARAAGVSVDFRQGDVAAMPFADGTFDLVVCQAAFKNFTQPRTALREMYRVLRPGGTAVIQDMRADTTNAELDQEVAGMNLTGFARYMTKRTFLMLRRRAYTPERFTQLVADSPFGTARIATGGIAMDVRMTKPDRL